MKITSDLLLKIASSPNIVKITIKLVLSPEKVKEFLGHIVWTQGILKGEVELIDLVRVALHGTPTASTFSTS